MSAFSDAISSMLDRLTDLQVLGIPGEYFFYGLFGFGFASQLHLLFRVNKASETLKSNKIDSAEQSNDKRDARDSFYFLPVMRRAMGAVGASLTFIGLTMSTLDQFRGSIVSFSLFPPGNIVALLILVLSAACIWIAANRTPKKMLIAVGSAFAFVVAAFAFEVLISVISFIEKAPA